MDAVIAAMQEAAVQAAPFLDDLPDRRVVAAQSYADLVARLGGPFPDGPADPVDVVRRLAREAEPGLVASTGPRYFGFVTGGSLPAAAGADWLATAWDQCAGLNVLSPAAAAAEAVAAGWVTDLLGLPPGVSAGFVTGGMAANWTCLAAARHAVLARAGWDVDADGLIGAPAVQVVVGAERHVTIDIALRYLGLGAARARVVPADDQGRLRVDGLREVLASCTGPTIVCAQAGNVNTGAFDPLRAVCEAARERGAWVHVDGAFGLWAASATETRHLVDGVELADSWATDAHKWLNVPYDSGIAFVADPQAHLAATTKQASYLLPAAEGERDPAMWTLEASRRARGFAVWAALASLGRSGVSELVHRCCRHARRFAEKLGAAPGVAVLNDVVLNQVLVRFADDACTHEVIARVQAEGTCWLGGTTWRGRAAMRIAVSNWRTSDDDVDRSVEAILRACRDSSTM